MPCSERGQTGQTYFIRVAGPAATILLSLYPAENVVTSAVCVVPVS